MDANQSKVLLQGYLRRTQPNPGHLSVDFRLRKTRISTRVATISKIIIFVVLSLLLGYAGFVP